MTHRNIFRGGVGIAAAAAIVLLVVWFAPQSHSGGPRSLDAVQAAMRTLEDVAAVEITTEWRRNDEAQPTDGWQVIVQRGVGYSGTDFRGERELYNLASQRRYRTQDGGSEIVTVRLSDDGMIDEFLRRTRVDECAEYFTLQRTRPRVDRIELRDGRSIRRIEATDRQDRPVTIELDVETDRLLLVDSVLPTDQPGETMRQTVRFRYPDPESIAPAIFEPPSTDGKRVIEEPASKAQCMVNAKNLCMAVFIYAQEHDNRLPPDVDALAPYAPGGDLAACRTCRFDDNGEPVDVTYATPESLGISTLAELRPDMILFRWRIAGGDVLGFGDGHAEFRARPE